MWHKVLCVFFLTVITSCTANHMVETDLYFGLLKPGGGVVTKDEWDKFSAEHISTVFKDGSTTIDATGSWRNAAGKFITEPTKVVICVHPAGAEISKQIDSLSNLYKVLFKQQSVLRVDKKATVTF